MKTFTVITIYLISLIPLILISQTPQKIDFQAIARDAEGIPIASQDIGVKIAIVKDSIGGEVVYEQADTITTDISGLFTLKIGDGNVITGDFSEIDWGTGGYYTKVAIDKEGGTNYIDMGAMEMVSVPYALYSEKSGTSYWDKVGTSIFYNDGRVGIGTIYTEEGTLTVKGINGSTKIILDHDSSVAVLNDIQFRKNNLRRWILSTKNSETGNNVGSNFFIYRYKDNGDYLGTVLSLRRSDGNVGIGTISPVTKLAVAGLTESTNGAYRRLIYNTSNGAIYYYNQVKENMKDIHELKDDFTGILQVQPQKYTDITSNETDIGFFADDFDKAGLNNLVIYNKENQPEGIKYDKISLYLVEIIKDQQKEIEDLKSRMAEIEKSQ